PPSRLCTTCIWRDGTTRPLPRLTSSRTAKCAQVTPITSSANETHRSMRDVRGVRSSTAARMSFAKAKSDDILSRLRGHHAGRERGGGGRGTGRFPAALLQQRDYLVARAVGDQPAALEQQKAIDEAEDREAVRRDDDGHLLGG